MSTGNFRQGKAQDLERLESGVNELRLLLDLQHQKYGPTKPFERPDSNRQLE